jgi:hypothetical protein
MSISFHCEYCNKKIEAPDNAGGKWGKCPSCHNKLYVPSPPPPKEEELKLAPLSEQEEEEKKRLMAETYRLSQDILQEKEEATGKAAARADSHISDKQLMVDIISYLRQMADGDLDQAKALGEQIVSCGNRAKKMLDKIALSEIPEPELADVPQHVLAGLIRTLRGKIS